MVSTPFPSRTAPKTRGYVRFARSAVVLSTVLATTFLYAGRASAAPATKINFQITNRTLIVTGSNGKDDISLRLRAGDPTTLEIVDVSKNVVLGVNRNDFESILVTALAGNDTVSDRRFRRRSSPTPSRRRSTAVRATTH